MIGLTAAALLLLVVVQYGSFNPDPLNDLTINFNIKDSPRAFADKEFEAEEDEDDPHPVIIGGEGSNKEQLKDLEVFDGEWKPFPPEMPKNRDHMAAVTFKNKLYVVGGLESPPNPNFPVGLFTMREDNGEWTDLPELKGKRYFHTATVIYPIEGPEILVTGGDGGGGQIHIAKSVEVYKLGPNQKKEWLIGHRPNMNAARIEHAAVVYKGELYVIGGRSTKATGVSGLQTVEVLKQENWQTLDKKLNQKRIGHAAETIEDDRVLSGFGDVIVVCGGKYRPNMHTEWLYLRSCETFNGEKWDVNNIGDMNHARANFGFMFYGGKLWAFGGYGKIGHGKDEVLSSVEFCAEESGPGQSLIWRIDNDNPLKKARSYFGVTNYIFPEPPSKNQPATRLKQANIVNSTFL